MGILEEKLRVSRINGGFSKRKRDFRISGGFSKRRDFRLNGGFAKRKRMMFPKVGDLKRENA